MRQNTEITCEMSHNYMTYLQMGASHLLPKTFSLHSTGYFQSARLEILHHTSVFASKQTAKYRQAVAFKN